MIHFLASHLRPKFLRLSYAITLAIIMAFEAVCVAPIGLRMVPIPDILSMGIIVVVVATL